MIAGVQTRHAWLVAHREWQVLRRSRATGAAFVVLLMVAWFPVFLVPLRVGSLGIASLPDVALLTLAIGGVILPLMGLLAGADALASELESGSVIPVVTLPLSRGSFFVGKCAGLASTTFLIYALSFGSALVAMALAHGSAGALDYVTVAAAGLLLLLSCGGLGIAIGAGAATRLRALALALLSWLVLVFAIDALLLAAVVGFAPPPPEDVGGHGHTELQLPIHGAETTSGATASAARVDPAVWLMTVAPIDLHRLSALMMSSKGRERLGVVVPSLASRVPWAPLVVGWIFWIVMPPLLGLWRFRRVMLTKRA